MTRVRKYIATALCFAPLLTAAIAVADVISISVLPSPVAVIAFPALHKVFVASDAAAVITIIDPENDTVSGIPKLVNPYPLSLGMDPVWGTVLAPSYTGNTVDLMDGATSTRWGLIPSVGNAPGAIAVDPTTERVYVALQNDRAVRVVDISGIPFAFLAKIDLPGVPTGIAVNGLSHRVYVTTDNGYLTTIDGATNTASTPVHIGQRATRVTVSSAEDANLAGNVYVTTDAGLVVVPPSTSRPNVTVPVPGAWGVAMNPATGSVFVTDVDNGVVHVIDGYTNKETSAIKVGPMPVAVDVMTSSGTLSLGEHKVYVANAGNNTVSVFVDPAVGTDLITVPVRWCVVEGSPLARGVTVPDGELYTAASGDTDAVLLVAAKTGQTN
jgi:YVTN family beta-propeller protein